MSTSLLTHGEGSLTWQCRTVPGLLENALAGNVNVVARVYPARMVGRRQLPDYRGLPAPVRRLYVELHEALGAKLAVLAAIGMRALAESVCIAEGAAGWGFEENVNKLVSLGRLTKD